MDFIYQNILLIALVVVSGVALILPMLMGSGANDVNPAAATLLINREDAQVIDVRELRKLGFAKIHNLSGGIDAWVGAGYPVKKGTRNR